MAPDAGVGIMNGKDICPRGDWAMQHRIETQSDWILLDE